MISNYPSTLNLSTLIENQFPSFVREGNSKFISFIKEYYSSQEQQYNSIDIADNLINYYNIGYYTPNKLVEKTELLDDISETSNTITVNSTYGFPEENGYILIDTEIIFYHTKTDTQFLNCVRGSSCLFLDNFALSNVYYRNSQVDFHERTTNVYNVAYNFAWEFFRRIKYEISPSIPEKLVDTLNLTTLLKNIKSFYLSKGSENSHKFLFRILFNERRVKLKLKSRQTDPQNTQGSGAKLAINNSTGSINRVRIVTGGQYYDNRKDSDGNLINPPIVDVFGSGVGKLDPITKISPDSATILVTDIDSSGAITNLSFNVSDGKGGNEGQSYRGPITASVRERNYKKDQVVEIIQNNILVGSGKVYSWDFSVNELVLYDIIGKFEKTSEVIGIGYENCRKFINNGIDSIEIIPIDPSVGDTKNNLFKPSSANYYSKNIAKIELLSYNNLPIQNLLLEQESDSSYHVKNIVFNGNDTVNITENKNIFQFSTDTDDNVSDLNLTASTVLSNELTTTTTNLFTITVDDANNFPVFDGILYIDGQLINYRSRSSNQFFGCIATHSKLYAANTEIWNYGRYLININRKWNSNTTYKKDSIVYYEDNLYICVNTIQGTTSNIPPTHVVGVKSDGTIRWKYHGKSNIKYVLKVYINNSKSFVYGRILSSTESPNILNSGALHSPGIFKFKKESSNLYSSKLLNYFRVNDSYSLDSTGGFQGVHSLYRHEDAYYVSSSGIPLYYDQSASLQYSNQKHLKRFKISNGLIDYPIKANITNQTSSEKSIGLTIDGIQIQSYKGREVTLNNSQYRYNLNYTLTTDLYGGYVHDIADDQYIDKNLNLQRSLGGNEYLQLKITSQFNDFYSIQNTSHGKIIGWSYDGHPIYSGKGYTTSLDKNSSLVNMTSSYRLKTSRSGGPSIVTYPLGTFIDDYEYVSGLGTLDEFNGRFCVTPEFPNGIYAYFAIFEFPYFIGPNYRSIPDKFNLSPVIRNDRIPSFFRRISRPNNVYYPKVNNDLGESILSNTISSGGVNSVIVEYSGNDYLSGDKVIFDNTGTSGSGAFAYVGEILGPELNYYEVVGNILSLYTKINHNLLPNDYIVLRTTPVEDIITKSLDSLSIIQSNVTITGKNLYRVNLLQDINYKLTTSKVGNFSLSYDINNDNKFYDENIIISNSPKYLQFNANTLPSTTYLHIDNNIYEIQIAKNPLFFKYTILQVTNNSFVIKTNIPESQVVELMQLYKLKPSSEVNIGNCIPYIKPSIEPPKIFFTHTSNSITAKGGIFSIELVNSGSGYKKLPKIISIDSQFGYGAIVQGDSTTIGSIKSLEYNSINKFIFSNYTIDYEIDLPISTKIIQNFYIDKIEIINRGLNYTKIPTILVNNQEIGKFEITVDSGQLTSIKVIDGLYNLKSEPIITVVGNGSNASVKAIIKRKNILKDSIVTKFGDTGIKGRVINFDSDTSILEILPISGKFNTNDIIVTNDNLQYGKIYSANYPQSISKSSSNSKLRPKFLNNVGFISSNTQKIPDSNYYQNYSYNISYVKNVSSWKSNVIDNTHVSGFKLFGKNLIENS